jgi:hypothetical protein
VNTPSDLPGIRQRVVWPAAALCAFVASGLEIFSFTYYLLLRDRAIESAGSPPHFDAGLIHGFVVAVPVIGTIAGAIALWSVGRRQRAVAPVSARLGQWSVAMAVVLVFVVGAFAGWLAGAVGSWLFHTPRIPSTLAFGCLGWASQGGTTVRQRWASRALLIVTAFGTFSLIWTLSDFPTGQGWLWFAALHVALRTAMWFAVGTWLRRVP